MEPIGLGLVASTARIANDLAVHASGNLFAVCSVSDDFAILVGFMSLDADGDLRTGFGDNGRRVLSFDDVSLEHTTARVHLQDDDKLLIGGHTNAIPNSSITDASIRTACFAMASRRTTEARADHSKPSPKLSSIS